MVGADLGQFLDEGGVVDVETPQSGESFGRLLVAAALDLETRRLGQDQHSADEDDGPGELHGNGDPVTPGVVAVGGRVVDDGRDEQADGDGSLIHAHDGTADPFGRRLGLVQRDDGTEETDAESGEKATGHE